MADWLRKTKLLYDKRIDKIKMESYDSTFLSLGL